MRNSIRASAAAALTMMVASELCLADWDGH
jgi:hypothetical protein